ncbi:MAG: ATP-binding cassette domain-containing protein [Acidimicrobiia bacterium]
MAATGDALLQVEDLAAGYGPVPVLADVSLHVAAGEIVALVGPNGAGKTTLVRSIAALHRPSGGRVVFGGEDVTGRSALSLTRQGMSTLLQGRSAFLELTVDENLRIAADHCRPGADTSPELGYELFPALAAKRHSLAQDLSGGQQRMVELARLVIGQPRLAILDEPSLGLAPLVLDDVFDMVERLRAMNGCGVLLVEQNVRRALDVCDRVYVLQLGRVVLEADATAQAEERIMQVYLGGGEDPMSSAMVSYLDLEPGLELGRREVEVTPEAVAAYNASIGRPDDEQVPLTIWDNDAGVSIPTRVEMPDGVQAKHDYEFLAPLAIGDRLLVVTSVEETFERKGNRFATFAVRVERGGAEVARARMTVLCARAPQEVQA